MAYLRLGFNLILFIKAYLEDMNYIKDVVQAIKRFKTSAKGLVKMEKNGASFF